MLYKIELLSCDEVALNSAQRNKPLERCEAAMNFLNARRALNAA